MELLINELDININNSKYEQIPENIPVKVIKKKVNVKFDIVDEKNVKPMKQTIPKPYAKISRPHIPEPKSQISYDDILSKMGMFVANGQLHLLENQPEQIKNQIKNQIKTQNNNNKQIDPVNTVNTVSHQNSYIYNKYFSDEVKQEPNIRVPKNITEYRNMLVYDILQKQRIKQVKSTKLIMPNSNINYAPTSSQNLNKLFMFSNR